MRSDEVQYIDLIAQKREEGARDGFAGVKETDIEAQARSIIDGATLNGKTPPEDASYAHTIAQLESELNNTEEPRRHEAREGRNTVAFCLNTVAFLGLAGTAAWAASVPIGLLVPFLASLGLLIVGNRDVLRRVRNARCRRRRDVLARKLSRLRRVRAQLEDRKAAWAAEVDRHVVRLVQEYQYGYARGIHARALIERRRPTSTPQPADSPEPAGSSARHDEGGRP